MDWRRRCGAEAGETIRRFFVPGSCSNCDLFVAIDLQISLKEGYQPTKKAEVKQTKKKPNILDKAPVKKQLSGSKENTPSPPSSPGPGSVATLALNTRVEELVSELQKMKAIILKHEVRIRDLEKKTETQASSKTSDGNLDNHSSQVGSEANNNGDSVSLLAPDEV